MTNEKKGENDNIIDLDAILRRPSIYDDKRIAELAKLKTLELARCRKDEAKKLGITVGQLDAAVREQRKQWASERVQKKAEASAPDPNQLWRNAGHIINHPRILDLFAADLCREIAGEEINGKLLYLVATSRLFEKPMHAAVKGTSAGGKSEIRKRILQYFPPESIVALTGMSEKALIYYEGDFAHKIFSMGEAVATEEQSFQDYLLRELMSEGRISYPTAQKVGDQIVTITIEKDGPVAFMVTTTKAKLHPENETRMISLEIDDSERQTKDVLMKVAEVRGLNLQDSVDYEPWRDFQRWLDLGDCCVVIPYADTLAELIPPAAVRLRRDFGQVLCAIDAHALLHREQRPRDEDGQIIADIENDYDTVRGLMNAILAEGAGVAVNPAMVETIKAVEEATATLAVGDGATAQDIGKILKLDKSAARRRLLKARDEGFVVNLEVRKGMQGKYRATQQEVELLNILPSAEELAAKRDEEGDDHSSPHTPRKPVPPCHREENRLTDHQDDGGKDGGKPVANGSERWHGGKPVANGLATVKSRTDEAKSVPVARWHENPEDTAREEDTSPSDIVIGDTFSPATDIELGADRAKVADLDIPDFLRRCEQCGAPSAPNKGAVTQRDFGGVRHWLHARCDFEF